MAKFEDLLGKTLVSVVVNQGENRGDDIAFTTEDAVYRLYHEQECCEFVTIDDINGDLENLVGTPITYAEESVAGDETLEYDSGTWTFYKLGTVKGWVDIRWYGGSNGWYSESVDFSKEERQSAVTSGDS